jgi:hypothetical protein
LSQVRVYTKTEELSFELELNPWAGLATIQLDGMSANIRCTATDEAGNYDSAWYNVTVDGIGPLGEVEIFEQSSIVFVNYTIDFQEDPVSYIITIKQDNVTIETISGDVDSQTDFTTQFEVGASSPGLWMVEMEMWDDVGNHQWVNSTMEVEAIPILADTLFITTNLIYFALGLLVIILITTVLVKGRSKKNQW